MNDSIITDISEINEIKYDSSSINYFVDKIIVINASADIPLHKFWIYIDKCKITKFFGDMITIVFSSKTKSVNIINFLETKIITKFSKISFDESMLSINQNDNVPSMTINLNTDTKFFDDKDESIFYNDLNENDTISAIIELEHLMMTPLKILSRWTAIQIQKLCIFDKNISLFKQIKEKNKHQPQLYVQNTIQNTIPPPITFVPPVKFEKLPEKTFVDAKIGTFVPSVSDLSKALGKLKKINQSNEGDDSSQQSSDKQINDKPDIPKLNINNIQLKHVVTKEPKSLKELYNDEIQIDCQNLMNIQSKLNIVLQNKNNIIKNFMNQLNK